MNETLDELKNIVVIYHGRCHDGFGGAWVANKKFGDVASYVSYRYGDDKSILEKLEGKEVFMVDVSFSKEEMLEVEKKAKRLVVIDHHKSTEEAVRSIKENIFDLNKSGSYLAFEYFFPNEEVPKLIQYISDNDIWKNEMPNCKEVTSYLHKQGMGSFTFENFDNLDKELSENFDNVIYIGGLIRKMYEGRVNEYIDRAEIISLEGYEIYAVNAPSDLRSGLGHELATKTNLFSLVFNYEKGFWRCSLRSVKDFDVSEIAKKFGGGGHKNAAGFELDTNGFVIHFNKLIKKNGE